MADVGPPISLDDSDYAAGRLLGGASRGGSTLLLQCLLFLDERFIFPFVFRVFGIVVLQGS